MCRKRDLHRDHPRQRLPGSRSRYLGTLVGLVARKEVPASIRSMELIRVGYWESDTDDRWPDPRSMVDPELDEDERNELVSYLQRGFVVRSWMGYSPCRICGANNGDLDVTDGVYIWPDGLAHYVDAHSVRLPIRFTDHIQARLDELENPIIDDSWWRSL